MAFALAATSATARPIAAPRATARASSRALTSSGRVAAAVSRRQSASRRATAAKAIEKSGPDFKPVHDIQEIKEILPHRYPFLLVDRVLEVEHGKYAIGYKNVTTGDSFFNGHFPQRAIMPGVLQVEALAQLGGIAMIDPKDKNQQNNFFFGGVDGVKWRRPVVPGDVLMMRVDVVKFNPRFGICKLDAKAYVGEQVVCEGQLTLVMAK